MAIFAGGAFVAALAAGLTGFAFALIASAAWLHVLPPVQAVPLIVGIGVLLHVVTLWRLRSTIRFDLLWPFLAGGVVGIPFGAEILRHAEPELFRMTIGVVLIAYCLYALARPAMRQLSGRRRLADGAVGMVGGVLGGAAGLSGIVPTAWCTLRGWAKDDQRGVYQPFILVMHALSLAWLGAIGVVDDSTIGLFAIALPPVAVGAWLGMALYARIDAHQFRRLLLFVLLASGGLLLM